MSAAIRISLDSASRAVIDRWREAPARIVEALDAGVTQWLNETEARLQRVELNGQPGSGGGGSSPVGKRSGALQRDLTSNRTGELSGEVGTTKATAHYARAILGPNATTIRPTRAEHLWVPIADNLDSRGEAILSPRALFAERDRDDIKFFTSAKGNKVVFLEDGDAPADADGRKPGDLLFVLKKEVVIEGTDALAKGVEAMLGRGRDILAGNLREAIR